MVQANHSLTPKQEEEIDKIIERFRENGLMSYEELDQQLPQDIQTPQLIDLALSRIEDNGVELGEEADIKVRLENRESGDEPAAVEEEAVMDEDAEGRHEKGEVTPAGTERERAITCRRRGSAR